jgi:hypothetical protein
MAVVDTQGATLRRNGVLIPQVKSISTMGIGRSIRDVTALSDAAHKHKLNIPDVPEVAVEVWYDPDQPIHNVPGQDEVNATLASWIIDIEQGSSPEQHIELGACYVFGAEVGPMEVDGDLTLKFTLKPQQVPLGLFD